MNCTGNCTICLEKLSEDVIGCQCKSCLKRYHLKCGNIDVNKFSKESAAKWTCSPCLKEKKLFALLESQQKKIAEIPTRLTVLEEDVETCRKNSNREQMIRCKSEIIISGLPSNIKNPKQLREIVLRMGNFLKLNINSNDIHDCARLNKGERVLVRFSNVFVRNDLMELYFKHKNLCLNNIMDTDVTSRVYINNNLPTLIHKSIMHCRKLKATNRIVNFKIDYISGHITLNLVNNAVENFEDFKRLSTSYKIERLDATRGPGTSSN